MTKQDYETPQKLFDKLNKRFHFNIDVCANSMNKKCKHYFDEYENGLEQNWWPFRCWMNPPFKEISKWVEKAYKESKKGATVVCLLRNDCSTKWWRYVMKAHEIIFVNQRVNFNNSPPPFSNVIVVFKPGFKLRKTPKVDKINY